MSASEITTSGLIDISNNASLSSDRERPFTSFIIFFCILGLCIFVYGISNAIVSNGKYATACKVIYIPEKKMDNIIPETYLRKRESNTFTEDQGDLKKYDYLYKE